MPRREPPSGRGGPRRRKKPQGPIVRRGTVRLTHEVARRIRAGHPWVYREALGPRVLPDQPGAPVELVDWDGEFVGHGFIDGESAISIRVISRSPEQRSLEDQLASRVAAAVGLRRRFLDFDRFQCLRLINGEADGLPGMFADRYGDYLVVQLYTGAVARFLDPLLDALEHELDPRAIYLQRRFRPQTGDGPRQGAELMRGSVAPVEFEVAEDELKFWVDVTAPLSTGLFPDLREGRRLIGELAAGRRVLNLFSYTGSISVYAKHGGAVQVTAVDVAAKAHARARRNFALNGFDAEEPEHIVGDAFKVLAKLAGRDRKFDMVLLDPPAFASASRGGKVWSMARDYGELVAAALGVLEPGGLLVASSATHKVSAADFDRALGEGAARARTSLRVITRRSLPVDFPTSPGFPEGDYLKFAAAVRD